MRGKIALAAARQSHADIRVCPEPKFWSWSVESWKYRILPTLPSPVSDCNKALLWYIRVGCSLAVAAACHVQCPDARVAMPVPPVPAVTGACTECRRELCMRLRAERSTATSEVAACAPRGTSHIERATWLDGETPVLVAVAAVTPLQPAPAVRDQGRAQRQGVHRAW